MSNFQELINVLTTVATVPNISSSSKRAKVNFVKDELKRANDLNDLDEHVQQKNFLSKINIEQFNYDDYLCLKALSLDDIPQEEEKINKDIDKAKDEVKEIQDEVKEIQGEIEKLAENNDKNNDQGDQIRKYTKQLILKKSDLAEKTLPQKINELKSTAEALADENDNKEIAILKNKIKSITGEIKSLQLDIHKGKIHSKMLKYTSQEVKHIAYSATWTPKKSAVQKIQGKLNKIKSEGGDPTLTAKIENFLQEIDSILEKAKDKQDTEKLILDMQQRETLLDILKEASKFDKDKLEKDKQECDADEVDGKLTESCSGNRPAHEFFRNFAAKAKEKGLKEITFTIGKGTFRSESSLDSKTTSEIAKAMEGGLKVNVKLHTGAKINRQPGETLDDMQARVASETKGAVSTGIKGLNYLGKAVKSTTIAGLSPVIGIYSLAKKENKFASLWNIGLDLNKPRSYYNTTAKNAVYLAAKADKIKIKENIKTLKSDIQGKNELLIAKKITLLEGKLEEQQNEENLELKIDLNKLKIEQTDGKIQKLENRTLTEEDKKTQTELKLEREQLTKEREQLIEERKPGLNAPAPIQNPEIINLNKETTESEIKGEDEPEHSPKLESKTQESKGNPEEEKKISELESKIKELKDNLKTQNEALEVFEKMENNEKPDKAAKADKIKNMERQEETPESENDEQQESPLNSKPENPKDDQAGIKEEETSEETKEDTKTQAEAPEEFDNEEPNKWHETINKALGKEYYSEKTIETYLEVHKRTQSESTMEINAAAKASESMMSNSPLSASNSPLSATLSSDKSSCNNQHVDANDKGTRLAKGFSNLLDFVSQGLN